MKNPVLTGLLPKEKEGGFLFFGGENHCFIKTVLQDLMRDYKWYYTPLNA